MSEAGGRCQRGLNTGLTPEVDDNPVDSQALLGGILRMYHGGSLAEAQSVYKVIDVAHGGTKGVALPLELLVILTVQECTKGWSR